MVVVLSVLGCVKTAGPPSASSPIPASSQVPTPRPPPFVQPGCGVKAEVLAGGVTHGGYLTVDDPANSGFRPTRDGSDLRADVDTALRFSLHRPVHGALHLREPLIRGTGLHLATTTPLDHWDGTTVVARLNTLGPGPIEGSFGDLGLAIEVPCSALVVRNNSLLSSTATGDATPMELVSAAVLRDTVDGPALATLQPADRTTVVWTTGERSGDHQRVDMTWRSGSRVAGWVDRAHLRPIALQRATSNLTMMGMGEAPWVPEEAPAEDHRTGILAPGTLLRGTPDGPAWGLVVERTAATVRIGADAAERVAVLELEGVDGLVREATRWDDPAYRAWVDRDDVQLEGEASPGSCATVDPDGRPCQQRVHAVTTHGVDQVAHPQTTFTPGPGERPVTVSGFVTMQTEVTASLWRSVTGEEAPPCPDCAVRDVSWDEVVDIANQLSERHGLQPAYTRRDNGRRTFVAWDRAADGWRLPTAAEWQVAAEERPVCEEAAWEACTLEAGLDVWIWNRPGEDLGGWLFDPAGPLGPARRIMGGSAGRSAFPDERADDVGVLLVRSRR
jgi:formylglycine-generating enzyme required for sulfatase activity